MLKRQQTIKVMVGDVQIGHQNEVVIQSMTNTKTANVKDTIKQIKQLVNNGCELVRVAVLDNKDAVALSQITKLSPCPIIADIHYNYRFAIQAIKSGVAKIRINPGNIALDKLKEVVLLAKKYNVAIRIGVNQGSKLNKEKLSSLQDMLNQTIKYIKQFEQ
jgi:(E)-4-hydroxy-3-methylbut-2-enyl-diphosphate synthase